LLCREEAQEETEARHDETEGHDREPRAHPREQRAFGGEEYAGIVHAVSLEDACPARPRAVSRASSGYTPFPSRVVYRVKSRVKTRVKPMRIGPARHSTTAAAASMLLACSAALAQNPGITPPPKTEVPAKTEAGETLQQQQARVHKLLEDVRQQNERPPET